MKHKLVISVVMWRANHSDVHDLFLPPKKDNFWHIDLLWRPIVWITDWTKAIEAEIAAVRIRQAASSRIGQYQLGMGNVTEKPGSGAKEIIFLAAEQKS